MKIDITHLAKLANLKIKDEEKDKLTVQLSAIIEYVGKLNELETKNIEPTSQVTGLENILRKDISYPSLSQEEAVAQTKNVKNGSFVVKGVLENE